MQKGFFDAVPLTDMPTILKSLTDYVMDLKKDFLAQLRHEKVLSESLEQQMETIFKEWGAQNLKQA